MNMNTESTSFQSASVANNEGLSSFSNEQLKTNTHGAILYESNATTNVVRHFVEIFQRGLHLELGFSSMFLMATKMFKYDKASAMRRTNAMELAIELPEILEKIDSREMCLESVANIQKFLKLERGSKRAYSLEAKKELIQKCLGLSTRKVQIELSSRNPDIEFSESKIFISKDRLRVSHTLSVKTEEKLERIRNLRSHVNPYMSRAELVDYMAEVVLDKIDPLRTTLRIEARKAERVNRKAKGVESVPAPEPTSALAFREEVINGLGEIQLAVDFVELIAPVTELRPSAKSTDAPIADPVSVPAPKLRSRYVKAADSRAVLRSNDDQCCDYVCAATEKRCGSHHQVQRDHIIEYSHGGSNGAGNLRLYCAQHNRWRWRNRSMTFVRAGRAGYG